ncbi:DUF5631 domain-containing protein [Mycobacterium fragae]|uniref:DUF5631 domain-containing protein n=1 Tax=Mycobacterium fragae TaxID=1260918 RepID=UPI000A1512DD|nr:DUF5631 domain-containing protein [Mycobacterium fragae]MCV7398558.1 DUF5631 domain-containing protein [Mycobacterium fragae]
MAIFGRNTARQRLRRATRESLQIPAFSSPVDCTPWVTGGLWPAELSTVTAETAPLVEYLKADLQRIVNAANAELEGIRRAGMADPIRQAEEARVINDARAFAVRRVESTVRHLRNARQEFRNGSRPVNGAEPAQDRHRAPTLDRGESRTEPISVPEQAQPAPAAKPKTPEPKWVRPTSPFDTDDTEVLDEIATVLKDFAKITDPAVEEPPAPPTPARHAKPSVDEAPPTPAPEPPAGSDSDREQLDRLLKFVARQESGLRWAIGNRDDGSTVLVTDLAHGWIPPGITLPAEVTLLVPERRTGNAKALLGQTTLSVSYAPGDALGWATDYEETDTSSQPRELPPVDDLGWALTEATHWRDGLPRMVHTLAKAGAAGTGVVDVELDVLRVHLEIARYHLMAQYPDVDPALLLNCLLLAATEGIATGDLIVANYHFAWFQMLSSPPPSRWAAGE